MDLKDATLMFLAESADNPRVASLARSAYDSLIADGVVDWRLLDDMIAEASGTGMLRAIGRKYNSTARDAIVGPVLAEIGRNKPVPPRNPGRRNADAPDPLTAPRW